jgi:hypothetical protein
VNTHEHQCTKENEKIDELRGRLKLAQFLGGNWTVDDPREVGQW